MNEKSSSAALTADDLDHLRRQLRRGRRVPVLSIGFLAVFVTLVVRFIHPAHVHAAVTVPGTFGPRMLTGVGLVGAALMLILLAFYVARVPVIRRAAQLEKDDPTALVFIGSRSIDLSAATWLLGFPGKKIRPPAYFCVSITTEGFAFWCRKPDWVKLLDRGWDRIADVRSGEIIDNGMRGTGIRRPVLLMTALDSDKLPVKIPLVAAGRGPAGFFWQPGEVIDSIARFCEVLRPAPAGRSTSPTNDFPQESI